MNLQSLEGQLKMDLSKIQNVTELMPEIYKLVEERDCAVNIFNDNETLVISIITSEDVRRIKTTDSANLISNIRAFFNINGRCV